MSSLIVSALYAYPMKSAAGIALETASLDALGIAGDRRWMLVDQNNAFLSQRVLPRMALLRVRLSEDARAGADLVVDAPGMSTLHVTQPSTDALPHPATIWRDQVIVRDASDEAAAWMS